jgi:glycosyltransferase involved in cell wall biosynthesis
LTELKKFEPKTAADENGQPLRVLCVGCGLDPRSGGPTVSSVNIWIALRRAKMEVVAATPINSDLLTPEIQAIERLKNEGIIVQIVPYTMGPHSFVRWGVSIPLLMWLFRSAKDFDIIQAHAAWMFSTVAAAFAARHAHRPFVLYPHESLTEFDVVKGTSVFRHIAKCVMKRIILSMTNFIIYASPFERATSFVSSGCPDSAAIYHPIFDDQKEILHARRWPSEFDVLRIGFLGRFDKKKNLEKLIEALAKVPHATLRVGGDGTPNYRRKLLDLAAFFSVTDRIEWLGFIEAKSKTTFFQSIDVLVMPSENEGFGIVAAEALLNGVPVVVSETTGISDLVMNKDCGIVVLPEPTAIATALESFNATRLEMLSRNSIAAVQECLSFSAYGEEAKKVYSRVQKQFDRN